MNRFLNYTFQDTPEDINVFDELPIWSAPFGLLMLKNIELKPNLTVLDIGSGAGFPLIELAERLGETCKCYGLDPWKNANERARQKIKNYDLKNVETIEGSAEQMPFENETFDLVASNLGIHNIDDPAKALQECHRVLKTEGRLVLITNLYGQWRTFYKIFKETLVQLSKDQLIESLNKHEQSRGTGESYFNLLHDNGFSPITSKSDEFEMRYLNGTAFLNHHFIKLGCLSTWKSIIPEIDWVEVFGLLEENLNQYAEEYGELKMTVPMLYIEAVKNDH
jgi:arsenite methyltransferase